jgi:hypothetical protein
MNIRGIMGSDDLKFGAIVILIGVVFSINFFLIREIKEVEKKVTLLHERIKKIDPTGAEMWDAWMKCV